MSVAKRAELRILAVSFDYRPRLGGVAAFAHGLLETVARMPGNRVRLLCPRAEGDAEFDRISAIETVRIPLASGTVSAMAPLGVALGVEIARWRPHAIVGFLWLPDGAACLLNLPLLRSVGIPYFTFAHGVEIMESSRTLRKRLRRCLAPLKRRVLMNSASVLANSDFTRDLVERECGVARKSIQVLNPGVSGEEFLPSERSDELTRKWNLAGKRVLLTVSRLESYKGIDRAIAALRWVVGKHPETIYLICGEGPDRSRLEALAEHYRVRSHVIFIGSPPSSLLSDIYNLADCFVLISREEPEEPNVEGFGIVYLEAAACGKPSIGGRSGGVPSAVEDGVSGWLVDPWDDQAIAAAMCEAIGSPEIAIERGRKARERALGRFHWDGIARKFLEEIRRHVRD